MLERAIRQAILTLSEKGNSQRTIAKSLGISRASVKKVLESGEIDVPVLDRPELLTEHLQRVRELHGGGDLQHLLQAHGGALLSTGVDHRDHQFVVRRLVRIPRQQGDGRGPPRPRPSPLYDDRDLGPLAPASPRRRLAPPRSARTRT